MRTAARRSGSLLAAALAAVALTATAVVPAAAATGGTPPPGMTGSQDTAESLAVKDAARSGKPVEVLAKRSETSDTVAQPDGKLKTTTYVQPKRVRKNGAWVDLDPTLQTLPGGAVAPKGSTADLRFSGGGSGPLVTMARAGKELKLSWPKPLPKPKVNGATAEYASILPDVDLRLSATRTGFTQVIVVHTAEAAKNPELDQLRLGLQGTGLTVGQEADGTLKAKDPSGGGTVFEAPVPVMWDSSKPAAVTPDTPATATPNAAPNAPANAPAAAPKTLKAAPQAEAPAAAPAPGAPAAGPGDLAAAGYGDLPGEGAKMTRLKVDLPKDGLVLSPDQGMLDAADTVYPVMIDPAWNTPHAGDWAGVSRSYPNQAYWHFTYNSSYVHDWGVGYCGDTSRCAPTDVKRAFFQVSNPFVGKQILSATFGTYESWSYSCDARPVELWNTGYISPGLNWNGQNASGFWSRYLQTINTAKGWSGSCPGGWLEYGEDGAVRNLVQDAANWGWPTISFGLKAQNEGDTLAWKRFTDDAYLSVYYNLRPNQIPMSDMTMSPGSVCQYPGIKINKMPQVTTRASDPDGEAIGVQFAVGWNDGSGLRRRWWSTGSEDAAPGWDTFKASGSMFSWPLPTGLPQNLQLDWEARAWDGAQWGPWSSDGDPTGCYFIVDTSAPDGPAITSDAYPGSKDATAALPWTDGVGKNGYFTLKSAATDVVKYQWGLDTSPSAANEIATGGGAGQTVRVQPQTAGVHFLSARAVDGAGNASQPETYYFNVLSGQTQRTGWSMDDAAGGTSVAGTGGSFEATLGSGTTPGAPGHLAEGLAFDGTANGYAETQGNVLDTTRGFAVSAWVNLTGDTTRNRVAVSENGNWAARFALGLMNGKWAMWTSSQDTNAVYTLEAASSDTPVVLGQWTHLVGVYDPTAKTSTLYVNGVPGTPVPVIAAWDARGPLEFGRSKWHGNWTDPWKGSVDEVRLWDRNLSKAEAADVAADKQLATGRPAKSVWHLDGASAKPVGTAETDSLTAYSGVALGTPGIADKAIHLDGVDDYLRGTRPQVDGSRDFSVSAWVKLPAPTPGDTTAKIAVSQIGQHNSEFSLYYSSYWKRWIFGRYKEDTSVDTLVRTWQPDCTPGTQINGAPCFAGTTGEWTHLLGVSDTAAKKLRFYINGFLVGESDYTQNAPWANPGPIQIGAVNREGANGEFFGGDIDDVRLYDRVVTGPEAGAMVQQRPQLAGRWKLSSATGTPAVTPDEGPAKAGAQLGGGASIKADGGVLPAPGTLLLDGSTGYAATGSVPLHTGQSFTLAGWANTAGVPTRDMTVLSVAGANNSAVTLRWHTLGKDANGQPTGQWQAEVRDSDATGAGRTLTAHTPATSVLENWTHLAVSYDAFADRLALYVGGQIENQGCPDGSTGCTPHISWTGAPQPYEATGGVQFGRNKAAGAWGEYFSGELDDVWLYQGVLSPAQITKLADYNVELNTSTGV
ncbi:LamG-like jellyroll fold domain-containing protein [Kitasatospora sp. NPDC058063]|uniref:LamG-like jellyroll fold domain-containing protein n=1 Tax=unclassified Kitasatospora TaxID=2633591 RepID=UPI0036DDD5AD